MGINAEAPPQNEVVSGKALEREMLHNMSPQQKKGFEMRSEVPIGGEILKLSTAPPPANDSSLTLDFDLKSIPKNMDMEGLKKAFGGYYIPRLNLAINYN